MKQPVAFFRWRPFLVMLFFSLVSLAIWGQGEVSDNGGATTITVTDTGVSENAWYMSPWVWVIGVAVFILLLVAILSSQGSSRVPSKHLKQMISEQDLPETH